MLPTPESLDWTTFKTLADASATWRARNRTMTTTITGYGGIGEIGGNAFLLEHGKTRLLLDFGKRFGNNVGVEKHGLRPGWGDYWDEFVKPRTFRLIGDLTALDLIPDMPALYRTDLGGAPGPAGVDGVLLSHAHMDHAGLIPLLKPEVPVVASPDSLAILGSIQATGASTFETEFVATKSKGKLGRNKDGSLSPNAKFADGPARAWSTPESIDIGAFTVKRFPVDHSIHGASSMIIEGPDISVAYTGDFRMHGRNGALSQRFVERAAGVDVLVAEGTRVDRPDKREESAPETDNERGVQGEIEEFVAAIDGDPASCGFVAIAYPPRDLDRFLSIHSAARKLNRKLAINTKQAHLLDALRGAGREDLPDPRHDDVVRVHVRAKNKGTLLQRAQSVTLANQDLSLETTTVDDKEFRGLLLKDYGTWERPYVESGGYVTCEDIAREPNQYLFSMNYWTIQDLFDIFPDPGKASGGYLHSATQPFNDEMEQDAAKVARWIKRFHLRPGKTHVSGHLGPEDLEWVLDKVGAKVLVPVHSLAPGVTAERYEARTGHRAVLPEWGRALDLA